MDELRGAHATASGLDVHSAEWQDESGVGGAAVLVGDLAGVADHFLQLLFPALPQSSLVAEHPGPGVLERGAAGKKKMITHSHDIKADISTSLTSAYLTISNTVCIYLGGGEVPFSSTHDTTRKEASG